MKILLLNTYDSRGGASIAVMRLLDGLRSDGMDVSLMVQEKRTQHDCVIGPSGIMEKILYPLRPYLDFFPAYIYMFKRRPFFPAILPGNIIKKIRQLNPDVLHLNWISGGMISLSQLATLKMPVVWTLHDMWPFTGGCHYSGACLGYEENCGHCPQLRSLKYKDLSYRILERKAASYSQMDVVFTTPSDWLTNCAATSSLLKGFSCLTIPNMLDVKTFYPEDKSLCREKLNLKKDKLYILFGAIDATSNFLKGHHLLLRALRRLKLKNTEFIVFGSSHKGSDVLNNYPVHYMGYIKDVSSLRSLYSAADVMLVPSLQEAFGQTITESMACGTPVVAFNATGPAGIIQHLENGFLADPFSAGSLAEGLEVLGGNTKLRKKLSRNARKAVENYFSFEAVLPIWKKLYLQRIDNK